MASKAITTRSPTFLGSDGDKSWETMSWVWGTVNTAHATDSKLAGVDPQRQIGDAEGGEEGLLRHIQEIIKHHASISKQHLERTGEWSIGSRTETHLFHQESGQKSSCPCQPHVWALTRRSQSEHRGPQLN